MAGYREFQTGEVLTAANVNNFLMNQSVMVFADSAARDTALGTAIAGGNALVEGMLTYNKDTGALEVYDGSAWSGVGGSVKKIAAFTSSGTWTVPAGVTYAIAHMMGGGGGASLQESGSPGGDSSVAFASGTVVGPGSSQTSVNNFGPSGTKAGTANLGESAQFRWDGAVSTASAGGGAAKNIFIVAGADVTPGASIAVTVGAGGAGTAAGGSGYVYIEYYE